MGTCKKCKEVVSATEMVNGYCKKCAPGAVNEHSGMKLMKDEAVILESNTGQLVLTSHRVRFDASTAGQRKIVSIMLDEICSCELNYKSNITLIILAGLSFVFGVAGGSEALKLGIVVAVALLAAYFLTRKQMLSLSSAASSIDVEVKGMKTDDVKDFIDAVEHAKFEIRK